jgi:hypothetical protein
VGAADDRQTGKVDTVYGGFCRCYEGMRMISGNLVRVPCGWRALCACVTMTLDWSMCAMGTNIGEVMKRIEIEGNEIHETFYYQYHRKD